MCVSVLEGRRLTRQEYSGSHAFHHATEDISRSGVVRIGTHQILLHQQLQNLNRERGREGERECVCVCVCVRERDRETERKRN